MNHRTRTIGTAGAMLALVAAAPTVHGSSHRETYATRVDPCIDNTDTYAWVEPGSHDKLNVVFNFLPLHEPGQGNQQMGPCEDVLYELHVARGTGPLPAGGLPHPVAHESALRRR